MLEEVRGPKHRVEEARSGVAESTADLIRPSFAIEIQQNVSLAL
jgi:hypothetical protein